MEFFHNKTQTSSLSQQNVLQLPKSVNIPSKNCCHLVLLFFMRYPEFIWQVIRTKLETFDVKELLALARIHKKNHV